MSQSFATSGRKNCFTCTSWMGGRTISGLPSPVSNKIYSLVVESMQAQGACGQGFGTKLASDTCARFSKLPNLD